MVGNLLQTLLDVQQTGFVSAFALRVQRPGQKFVGLGAALFGLGAQASLFGLALFLLAGRHVLSLAPGLLLPHLALESQQGGMAGHGPQALFDLRQTLLQRAFLPGALGLFQKLLGPQFGLQPLFLLSPLNPGSLKLPVDLLAQGRQIGMIGRESRSLLDQGAAVFQRAFPLALAGWARSWSASARCWAATSTGAAWA